MSPLLGNKDERAAEKAAMNGEIQRLCMLSVRDLAAEVFPAWGPSGPRDPSLISIPWWLMNRYPHARQSISTTPLTNPIAEAVQLLEHSGLLLQHILGGGGSRFELTRFGAAVLAKGNVRDHLPQRGPA